MDLVRASEEDRLRKLVANLPNQTHKIFDGDLATMHSAKIKLTLNRPICVGQAILDLSKHLMYDFWYNQVKTEQGEKAQLLYTDTDSLLFGWYAWRPVATARKGRFNRKGATVL